MARKISSRVALLYITPKVKYVVIEEKCFQMLKCIFSEEHKENGLQLYFKYFNSSKR